MAGKTGTAEKQGQADFAWFAAFGPATWPERGFRHDPEVVVAMVLEEAGFGGDVAAPAVARVLLPIATHTVDRARTAREVDACYAEVKHLASFLEGGPHRRDQGRPRRRAHLRDATRTLGGLLRVGRGRGGGGAAGDWTLCYDRDHNHY